MSYPNEPVQLSFRYDEKEFLAATRLYFWHSKELMVRLIVICLLFGAALLVLNVLLGFFVPFWAIAAFTILASFAWFRGVLVDLPRTRFRGDPKFRDEYNLTFTDEVVEFKTHNIDSKVSWDFYNGVIEDENFYVLIYGRNIHSLSILPKRAFRDSQQETIFRQLLRRHIDPNLKLNEGEQQGYVPRSLEPPDWR